MKLDRVFEYLVVKEVPDRVQEAGDELRVAEQRTDEPGGPRALSADTEKSVIIFTYYLGY